MVPNWMHVIKAKWLRFWHCLFNITNGDHRLVDETIEFRKCGITLKRETLSVRCACGKIFYKKQDGNEKGK